MFGSLLPDFRDIQAINERPPAIPTDATIFRILLGNGLNVGYASHLKAIHVTDWFARHGVDVLMTPWNVRIVTFEGLTRTHEILRTVDRWNEHFGSIGPLHLPGTDDAWRRAVDTYHALNTE